MVSVRMARPRIKPEHSPFRIAGGRTIRIGGITYGTASEVDDPTGSVWVLLECMDGTRTVDEIVARVVELCPDESAESVRAAVATFIEAGHVEDAGAPVPTELRFREVERYDRSRRYFSWLGLTPQPNPWQPQLALRKARVTVVGLGGTGGVASMALAASGVGRLRCVDSDQVQLSNLNRQIIYTEDDIGRPKVDAAVSRLRRLNSDIHVEGERRRIEGIADLAELAADCDVLLLAADQPREIRMWANRACLATGTPWVTSGYHGAVIPLSVFRPGEGPCFECVWATQTQWWDSLDMPPDQQPPASRVGANAIGGSVAGISGYLGAHAVVALLTGIPRIPVGSVQTVNLAALDAHVTIGAPRRSDCPACGPQPPMARVVVTRERRYSHGEDPASSSRRD